jgi:hypothetical protein
MMMILQKNKKILFLFSDNSLQELVDIIEKTKSLNVSNNIYDGNIINSNISEKTIIVKI